MAIVRLPMIVAMLLGVSTAVFLAVQHRSAARLASFRGRMPDRLRSRVSRQDDRSLRSLFWHPGVAFNQTLLLPASSALRPSPCSCWNSSAAESCCQRAVVTAHKLGILFSRLTFKPFPHVRLEDKFNEPEVLALASDGGVGVAKDHRHVAIVRNMFSAAVSGYLYHKSGRECWLNPWGKPRKQHHKLHAPGAWEAVVFGSPRSGNASGSDAPAEAAAAGTSSPLPSAAWRLHPFPAVANRSLCQYLAEESEEAGLKLYMAFVLSRYHAGMVSYLEAVRQQMRSSASGAGSRTLLVCLEEASNPAHEREAFDVMMGWLHPGGHDFAYVGAAEGSEGHRTDHSDREKRTRLLELVRRLDRDAFGGAVSRINGYFDCAETAR